MLQFFAATRKEPGRKLTDSSVAEWLGGGAPVAAGIAVTPESALSSTVVLACVRAIAEDVAKLPLHLYRRDARDRRVKDLATDHPLYWLLKTEPNPYQTSFEFREWLQASELMYGYGVAEIETNRYGQPVALWPLMSPRVSLEKNGDQLIYWVESDTTREALLPEQVLHIKGFSPYGLVGSSLIKLGREAIGLDLAQQQYSAQFFSNGASPRGVLQMTRSLSKDAQERLKDNWNSLYKGLDNAHRVAVLEEGMTFNPIGVSPKNTQLVEGRTYSVADICRIFRMQPHKVAELSRSTFANIEHQALENVNDTLMPHLVRWEQRIEKSLLTLEEKRARLLFVKFAVNALLRGDSKSRADYLKEMVIDSGIMSINEAREIEDLNPTPGGDEHRVPINTAPLGSDAASGNSSSDTTAPGAGDTNQPRRPWER